MKVLIDECVPFELKAFLSSHGVDCATVTDAGWSGKTNGELLSLADQRFDAFATVDKNLRYQQNLAALKIAIVVIRAQSNRIADLRRHFPACLAALLSIKAGEVVEVGL